MKRILFSLLLITVITEFHIDESRWNHAQAQDRITTPSLGIAITPKDFPSHTLADVDDAFKLAQKLGNHTVSIYQWHALNLNVARLMVQKTRQAGMRAIIGLSPTTLGQKRKELDLPVEIRRQASQNISFANPVIREAFKKTARDLARLRPPYLCMATEINFLALQRLKEYLHFASLYKEAYRQVKRISPNTKVFVSFQWEWMRIIDARQPHKIKDHSKVIDILRPELDMVALTTYPSPFHESPEDLPHDYYSWIYQHISKNKEVLLMEVGWPTKGSGNESEQQAFIKQLPNLLRYVNASVIAWALLHDVELAEFDANLNSVGLITKHGRKKPGYNAFKKLNNSLKK
jgi:hypothetical protein